MAAVLHVKHGEGVIIAKVTADSPAAEAGLQTGDIIVDFNGTKVHNPAELVELVERATVGGASEALRPSRRKDDRRRRDSQGHAQGTAGACRTS